MEIPETKSYNPKGFELGTTLSWPNRSIQGKTSENSCPIQTSKPKNYTLYTFKGKTKPKNLMG